MRKKVMLMTVLFLALVILTGCGGKKLTCTTTEDGEISKLVANFKNNKVTTMTTESTEVYETEEEAENSKKVLTAMLGVTQSDYLKFEIKQNGKELTTIMTLDLTKMTDEQIAEEIEVKQDISYDGLKEMYESQGFECK